MKKFLVFSSLLFSFAFLFASPAEITITPDIISSSSIAPEVCISNFKADSVVVIMVPSFSYSFITTERGTYCHSPNYTIELAPGIYDVPSIVCRYVAGSIPTRCKSGPSTSLIVQ